MTRPSTDQAAGDRVPVWEARFRAPQVGFPHWARDAPECLVFGSDDTGSWQVHALDQARGMRWKITDEAVGVRYGLCAPDGRSVVWFHDVSGDESGHWLVAPFADESIEPEPLLPSLPDGWSQGLALGAGVVVAGLSRGDGFEVHAGAPGAEPTLLHRHAELVHVGPLSRDEALVALEHAERGDSVHLAVRVVDARDGTVVAELHDGPGLGLQAVAWSPVPGDQRLALVHERVGLDRPAVWDPTTGERRDLPVDVPGDVSIADWWPDGSALLLLHHHEGRDHLLRLDLTSGVARVLDHPQGTITSARVRPDREVWLRWSSGAEPPSVTTAAGDEVLAPNGPRPPLGQPFRSWWFDNRSGDRVHGFVVTPPDDGSDSRRPCPVVMLVHGGPTYAYTDQFMPDVQAWVDHGFAVGIVNYRGSTGYGVAWRDRLLGDPGFLEVEDVVSGLDDLVAAGVADPSRAVVAGRSWGGYVTLMALGLEPERWAAGVAVVPVGDFLAAYEDEAPSLQAYDRTLFGGPPEERGDLFRERSPLTYVDRVRAPVLVVGGDNDSRCPIRQILNYVDALERRGGEIELRRYDAGHASLVVEEQVEHMRWELDFVLARVPPGGRS